MTKIKIKKMTIHNFLSFYDEEWDFDNTSRLVLVKGINKDTESARGNTSNGSGKSTWANALMYSLFGQLNGKFHIPNLQNQFCNTMLNGYKMSVDVEVDTIVSDTVKHWRIVRGLQKTKSAVLQLFSQNEDGEWVDISKSSSANTQKFIEENVLHMNFEMYQRLVMLSIEDKYNFFKLNAAQRREFVETMFDTMVYSKMFKMMTDELKSKNMIFQSLKVNKVRLDKSKEVCEDEIERYKASVNEKIKESNKEKEKQNGELEKFGDKFDEINKRKEVLEDALKTIRENTKKLDDVIRGCNDTITDARIEIGNCESTISHHQRELNKHKEVLGMICDDCKAIVNKFYSLDVYRNEIDKLQNKINEQNKVIDNATSQIDKVGSYDAKLKESEKEKMGELSECQVEERNLQFQKMQIVNSISSIERRIADLVESIDNTSKIPSWNIYQKTLNEISEIEKNMKDEITNLCLLKVGSEIVSPESIQKNIISKVVSSINAIINDNLNKLCVNFTCNLSPDMNDYQIMSNGEEVDLALRSTGERMKLLISTQLAFRKFLMSRFNVGMNVMIIDEVVDQALDSVSIQMLLEMLLQLSQKENTNVSIISHRGEVEEMVKGMPETQLVVIQKENDVSKVLRD